MVPPCKTKTSKYCSTYLRIYIHVFYTNTLTETQTYCKHITFGGVFFLVPLAIAYLRSIKLIAKCAFKKDLKSGFQSTTESNPR